MKEAKSKHSEEVVEVVYEDSKKISAEKLVNNSSFFLKCDQCDHTASCKANLRMHINEEHKEVENEDVHPITSSLSKWPC